MSKQNIFDNEKFFEGYRALRENPDCANNLTEKPALFSMLGEIKGKRILDLGCGYGENCLAFSKMGARSVTGTDISEKLQRAVFNGPCFSGQTLNKSEGGFVEEI